MYLNPQEETGWRIASDAQADVVLPACKPSVVVEAEITWVNGRYRLQSIGSGEVRINKTPVVKSELPDSCYLWFGLHRYKWHNGTLVDSPPRGYLYVQNLSVKRKVKNWDRQILQNLSFGITHDTGMTGIFGPSGCGKSTLIKEMIAAPFSNRKEILCHPECAVGYIPQEDHLPAYLTVEECLKQTVLFRNPSLLSDQAAQKAMEIADLLGLKDHFNQEIESLSGGQRKRVSVAMELSGDPDILLLDEPTTGLDPQSQKGVMDYLRQISRTRDISVICVTHALETLSFFDQVLFLRPLDKPPRPEESSLIYAGPWRSGTAREICGMYGLEMLSGIFLPQPLQQPTNRTPSSKDDPLLKPPINNASSENAVKAGIKKRISSLGRQSCLVAYRAYLQVIRNVSSIVVTLALPFLVALFVFMAEARAEVNCISAQTPGLYLTTGIAGIWLGMNLLIRSVVSERESCRRDLRAGLHPAAYSLGKIVFLLGAGLVQTLVITISLTALHAFAPWDGSLRLPWPNPSIVVPFGLGLFLMITGGGLLGLAVSALAKKEYVAVTFLPILLIPHLLFNMSAYGGRYEDNEHYAYNPVIFRSENDVPMETRDRIHEIMSRPLISRPYLNMMEFRSYLALERGVETAKHPNRLAISNMEASFQLEWLYMWKLLAWYAFIAAVALYINFRSLNEISGV